MIGELSSQSSDSFYIVIIGHGRSGSNRLLDAFDKHPATLCRNEPNETLHNPFSGLRPGFSPLGSDRDFIDAWRRAIATASREVSNRDRIGVTAKNFAPSRIRRLVAQHCLSRASLRRLLGLAAPPLLREQWPASLLYADPRLLNEAIPVFKILLNQGWILDAYHDEHTMKVVHNIRAPKAFLVSWYRRYAAVAGQERVYRENLATLESILPHFGETSKRMGAFSRELLFESELWRWRYVNEIPYVALQGAPRYTVALYESFEKNPADETRRLFDFAGLSFTSEIGHGILNMKNRLFHPQPSPRDDQYNFLDSIIDRVLKGSPLYDLVMEAA
ncbi:MAG: hypothetical protein GC153_10775 [Alphaproteobacteria bacterium]|nr:hypothetical protein [Alphaproteobacteria bacterium]